jgi:hypothetical protein
MHDHTKERVRELERSGKSKLQAVHQAMQEEQQHEQQFGTDWRERGKAQAERLYRLLGLKR